MKDELISRDKLLKMTKSYKSELGRLLADPFVKLGVETVESFIRDMPTITPTIEERPTGEWLEWEDERWGGVWHYCSNCHNDALYKNVDGIFKQILSDFCPYCGVKMKGGEEECIEEVNNEQSE